MVLGWQDMIITEQAALGVAGLLALHGRHGGLVGAAVIKDGTGHAVRNTGGAAVHGIAEAAIMLIRRTDDAFLDSTLVHIVI